MPRDEILIKKDKVQRKLWREAGGDASAYVALVHEKAQKLRHKGLKLKYAK